jgi:hypothetical protein
MNSRRNAGSRLILDVVPSDRDAPDNRAQGSSMMRHRHVQILTDPDQVTGCGMFVAADRLAGAAVQVSQAGRAGAGQDRRAG